MNRITPAAIAVTAVLAVGTLSACSSDSNEPSSSSGGQSFTYWSMWRPEEPQAQVIKAAVEKFTADTGIKVDLEFQGRDVRTKIGPALAANNAPDLWDQGADAVYATAASRGQAADLSDVFSAQIPGEQKTVGDVVPAKYLDSLPKDPSGKNRWLVPYEVVSAAMFYNAADSDLAKTPTTWDEFIALCSTLKAKNKPCIASDGDLGWENFLLLDYLLVRDNGPDTLRKIFEDKSGAGWDAPGVATSVGRIEQLVKGGFIAPGYDASKYPAMQTKWAQGGGGFLTNGSWVPSEVAKLVPAGWKNGAMAVPVTTNPANNQADVILFGWSVTAKAKNPAPAKKFIAYFLQKSVLEGIATKAENITPRADIPAPESLAAVQKILADAPARSIMDNVDGDFGDKVIFPSFLKLWQGKIDTATFLAEVKKAHVAYWKAKGQ